MPLDVPFSKVLELLENHGYCLLRRRKFPDEQDAGLAVFGREGGPNIGLEVRGKRVPYEQFQSILEILEGQENEPPDES